MRVLAPCLLAVANAYPGQHLARGADMTKSSHYASTIADPPLPTLPIWPLPHSGVFAAGGAMPACLSPTLTLSCTGACPAPLPAAFDRYAGLMFFAGSPSDAVGTGFVTVLNVSVSADAPLGLGVSENYTLTLPTGVGADTVAVLTADTQWGALRGLETFSQFWQWSGRGTAVSYCTANANLKLEDWPRYPWRGILVDSSRHFLPVSALLITLDAMVSKRTRWPARAQRAPHCATPPPPPLSCLAGVQQA